MLKALWRKRRGTLVVLAVLAAAMAWGWLAVRAVPDTFQHVWPAPAPVSAAEGEKPQNSWLRQTRYAAEGLSTPLDGACEGGSLYAVAQPAAVGVEDGKSVSARLVGVEKSYFQLHEPVLLNGRQLYPDECTYGERAAMVDEQLAVALFQYAEPLGEKLVLDGQAYRIVGVIKAGKQVGDGVDYALYVPLRALEKSGVALTAMVYEARPVKGAGGWPAFQAEAAKLGQGTTVSLVKEKMNAAMPLRLLVCLCLGAAALHGVKGMNRAFGRFAARWRERIQEQYAARLLGWALWRCLLLLAGYAACAAALAGVFVKLVEPVYTFPEWVPAILVEPKDIQTAFWNVWQTPATVAEYRMPQLIRLRFLRELLGWCAGLAGLLLGSLWGRLAAMLERR